MIIETIRKKASQFFGIAAFKLGSIAMDVAAVADRLREPKEVPLPAAPVAAPIERKPYYVVGFGPIVVPAGKTINVRQVPDVNFKPLSLVNTGDEAGLYITGLKIGAKSQFMIYKNKVSVRTFDPRVQDNNLEFSLCRSEAIEFEIVNTSESDSTFSMSLSGFIDSAPKIADRGPMSEAEEAVLRGALNIDFSNRTSAS